MTRASVAVFVCGLLLSIPAVPQQTPAKGTLPPPAPQQKTPPPAGLQPAVPQPDVKFTGGATEIIVPVTVRDSHGKFVANLEKEDFRIEDEGRPQKITYFYHDTPGLRQNTVIGFIVDMSSSALSHWDKFREATKELIWQLLPNDPNYSGYLISAGTTAELRVNTTSDPDALTAELDRMKPGGGSSLYNGIYKACTDRKVIKGEPYQPRRVVIVVGDGHDTASQYTLDQVIELAQRNHVSIFAVSTVSFGASSEEADNLQRLTTETGGHVETPLDDPYSNVSGYLSQPSDEGNYALHVGTGGYTAAIAEAINKTVMSLEGELTNQYILRYVPDIDPATEHREKRRIKVDIMSLPAGSVKVQARPYYWAQPVRPIFQ